MGQDRRNGRVQALVPVEVGAVGRCHSGGMLSPSSGIRGRAVFGGRGTAHDEAHLSSGLVGGCSSGPRVFQHFGHFRAGSRGRSR